MTRSLLFAIAFYSVTAIMATLYLPMMVLPRRVFLRLCQVLSLIHISEPTRPY